MNAEQIYEAYKLLETIKRLKNVKEKIASDPNCFVRVTANECSYPLDMPRGDLKAFIDARIAYLEGTLDKWGVTK